MLCLVATSYLMPLSLQYASKHSSKCGRTQRQTIRKPFICVGRRLTRTHSSRHSSIQAQGRIQEQGRIHAQGHIQAHGRIQAHRRIQAQGRIQAQRHIQAKERTHAQGRIQAKGRTHAQGRTQSPMRACKGSDRFGDTVLYYTFLHPSNTCFSRSWLSSQRQRQRRAASATTHCAPLSIASSIHSSLPPSFHPSIWRPLFVNDSLFLLVLPRYNRIF